MKLLSVADKRVLAMAIDCEGCISITQNLRRKNIEGMLQVDLGNTNITFLLYLCDLTGIGIIDPGYKYIDKNWKKSYKWRLRRYEMLKFIIAIEPYLIIKRDQAMIMIEYLERRWSKPLSEEDINLRRVMISEMKELNQTGEII
jgi:hypothetical protein